MEGKRRLRLHLWPERQDVDTREGLALLDDGDIYSVQQALDRTAQPHGTRTAHHDTQRAAARAAAAGMCFQLDEGSGEEALSLAARAFPPAVRALVRHEHDITNGKRHFTDLLGVEGLYAAALGHFCAPRTLLREFFAHLAYTNGHGAFARGE